MRRPRYANAAAPRLVVQLLFIDLGIIAGAGDRTKASICRKSTKIGMLRRMAACTVSYLDTSGIRHSVEVEAESLYEAAALAVKAFRRHDCEPRGLAKLEVEMRSSVIHTLTIKRLEEWLAGACKSPREAVMKERLRQMIDPTQK